VPPDVFHSDGCDQKEAGDRRRRRLRQDVSAHRVQQGSVPRGLRAHGVRELRGRYRGGRETSKVHINTHNISVNVPEL